MNRPLYLAAILVLGACVSLSAQKREEALEVDVDEVEATPVGVSITLRAHGAKDAIHMMVGFNEGQSIARAIGHQDADRPSSYDLFKSILDRNGWRVKKVLIRSLMHGTYMADMTLENGHESQVYDCRPSDAMAIGLRYDAKIYVNQQVFDEEKKAANPDYQDDKEEEPSSQDQLTL